MVDETATGAPAELNYKEADSSEPIVPRSSTAGESAEKVDQLPAPNTVPAFPPAESNDDDTKSPIFIFTSFSGGGTFGRNITTATNRLELILKANNISYELVDLATNEQAKKLWARSSRGKKLPGVVKGKDIVGNYEDIEEANEFGEVQQLIAEFV
ncbi:hypothetical protein V1509DRAFT_572298 [Lipomyces kononenkoae]